MFSLSALVGWVQYKSQVKNNVSFIRNFIVSPLVNQPSFPQAQWVPVAS